MTQTQPDKLDRLESFIERIDRKLDAIASDVQDMKLESRVFQARADERFNSIDKRFSSIDGRFKSVDTQLSDIKVKLRAPDTRLWGFIATLSETINFAEQLF